MADAIPLNGGELAEEIRAILTELAAHEKQLSQRHEALAEAVELFHHDVQSLRSRTEKALEKDANSIRSSRR